VDFTLPLAT